MNKAPNFIMKRLEITKAYLRIKTDLVEWFKSQTGVCRINRILTHLYLCCCKWWSTAFWTGQIIVLTDCPELGECAAAASTWIHLYYSFMAAWVHNFKNHYSNIQRNVRKNTLFKTLYVYMCVYKYVCIYIHNFYSIVGLEKYSKDTFRED